MKDFLRYPRWISAGCRNKILGALSICSVSLLLFACADSREALTITAAPEPSAEAVSLGVALERASQALAEKRYSSVTVELSDGVYRIDKTLMLGAGYSGLSLVAAQGQEPVISSGVPLTGWVRSAQPPADVPASVRDQVWEVALPQGAPVPNMLYDAQGILPMARGGEFKPAIDDRDPRMSKRTLYLPPEVLRRWSNPQDILISIVPRRQWSHNILRVKELNFEEGWLQTDVECSYEMVRLTQGEDRSSVYILNAPETLDEPGEWIVDSSVRKIYHIPRDGKEPDATIVLPLLHNLLQIGGTPEEPVRSVTVDGVAFKHTLRHEWQEDEKCVQHDWESVDTANGIIVLRNAQDCVIRNCLISLGGSAGVRFDLLARRNVLENCEISVLGGNGVFLGGLFFDERDVNRENVIHNNHIHGTGLVNLHGSGILVAQSGANRITNNLIHDTGYSGIILSGILNVAFAEGWRDYREIGRLLSDGFVERTGLKRETQPWDRIEPYLYTRDNLVEGNELFNNVLRCGDGNPVYLRGAGQGNIIRRNFVHHALGDNAHGAIRMDDGQWGTTVEDNIIYMVTWAGITTKGVNAIINNIVVDVLAQDDPLNARGVANRGSLEYRINLPQHNLGQPPVGESQIRDNIFLSTRSGKPKLLQFHHRYMQNGQRRHFASAKPEENGQKIAENVSGAGVFTNNLYWDAQNPDWAAAYVTQGNRAADPLLADPERGDFSFAAGSAAAQMGIRAIDAAGIGIDVNALPEPFRQRLPQRPGKLPSLVTGTSN